MLSSDPIRLIVNADDFGFTRGVNDGIVAAHRGGLLTATTLMANGGAFDHAVSLARDTPSLDIGCHLVFVQGMSAIDPSRHLPATLGALVRAVVRRDIPLYEEARAQVRRVIDAGIQPSHIDTHKHTHLLPPVLDAVSRAAREFGIEWVRRPFDPGFGKPTVMKLMRPHFDRVLRGLRSTDSFAGFALTGALTAPTLAMTLETLRPGLTELMCHPGYCDAELEAAPTRLKASRAAELAALTSREARGIVERRGIRLTDYRDTLHFRP